MPMASSIHLAHQQIDQTGEWIAIGERSICLAQQQIDQFGQGEWYANGDRSIGIQDERDGDDGVGVGDVDVVVGVAGGLGRGVDVDGDRAAGGGGVGEVDCAGAASQPCKTMIFRGQGVGVKFRRCGGSLAALQTTEALVPGSNPAFLTVKNSEDRQSH